MLCREQSLVNQQPGTITVVPLRCKCWHCDECAPMRQAQLRQQVKDGAPDTFITLTVKPVDGETPDARARNAVIAWREVRRQAEREAARDIDRKPTPHGPEPAGGWPRDHKGRVPRQVRLHGTRVPFIAVCERHKSGEPHIHIAARSKWIGQQWLSAWWEKLTGAFRVDIRRCRDVGRLGAYVAKYMAKQAHKFAGGKHYWSSHDYRPKQEGPDVPVLDAPKWRVSLSSVETFVRATLSMFPGYSVEWDRDAALIHSGGSP